VTQQSDLPSQLVEAVSVVVQSLSSATEQLAAARFLASARWTAAAAALADAMVVEAREAYPLDTYEDTADRLGVSYAAVARAVTRHRARTNPDRED
jgi:hypothetical protein